MCVLTCYKKYSLAVIRKFFFQVKKRSTNEDAQIGIFPEGTCTNRSSLITFKGGAFIPGVPVQPVCLEFFHDYDYVSWVEEGWCLSFDFISQY